MQEHAVAAKQHGKRMIRIWAEVKRCLADASFVLVTLIIFSSFLLGCAYVHRFHVVRYSVESSSGVISGQGKNLHLMECDGIRVTFQRAYAHACWTKNPGVGLTLILENTTSNPVKVDTREISFSRFPARDAATQTAISPVYVWVEPAEQQGDVWEIAAKTTAKVHVVFQSPARTPGYVRLVVQKGSRDEQAVFTFKVTRIPPTNS
ncbi:MAG TPA: hypothetical protein PKY35_08910 [Candidatus Hydrogenedentes bacterium]|nr:hypothetical protein [Candidatus Hydrogenedentota bacterium]HOL77137.1 hypothetical protein [Candidatus Hydrogenedentota bacterium]